MDGTSFDRLVRFISENGSRRGLFRSAFAATLAGVGVSALLSSEETAAKSCKAKCNKKKTKQKKAKCKKKCDDNGQRVQCKSENARCFSPEGQTGECCASEKLVCDVPFGASNSDTKCCRGHGAACTPTGSGPKCCVGEGGEREYTCDPATNTCVVKTTFP